MLKYCWRVAFSICRKSVMSDQLEPPIASSRNRHQVAYRRLHRAFSYSSCLPTSTVDESGFFLFSNILSKTFLINILVLSHTCLLSNLWYLSESSLHLIEAVILFSVRITYQKTVRCIRSCPFLHNTHVTSPVSSAFSLCLPWSNRRLSGVDQIIIQLSVLAPHPGHGMGVFVHGAVSVWFSHIYCHFSKVWSKWHLASMRRPIGETSVIACVALFKIVW